MILNAIKTGIAVAAVAVMVSMSAATPASAMSIPGWVNPVWEFLSILFDPVETGGCDAAGKHCLDML